MWQKFKCWIGWSHEWKPYNGNDNDKPTCQLCGRSYWLTWSQCEKIRDLRRKRRELMKEIQKVEREAENVV